MKLVNFLEHKNLNSLREEMGADLVESITHTSWENIDDNKLNILLNTGEVEVEVSEIKTKNGVFVYKDRQVLVYIRDQHANYYSKGYKFHLTDCNTISQAFKNKRNSRYVVSLNTEGIFNINLINYGEIVKEGLKEKLNVCKNCLEKTNYKNYKAQPYEAKNLIYNEFVIADFFNTHKSNRLKEHNYRNSKTAPLNTYNKSFGEKSLRIKQQKNYTCEECLLDLSQNKRYCHSHHIDGDKTNDADYNLKVLCIECHSIQPAHAHIKNTPDYKDFMRLKELDLI